MAGSRLARLEQLRAEYGERASAEKLALLEALAEETLTTARAVARLHEALCWLRAYPDDARLLAQVERMLDGFDRRRDLRRRRRELADSGIAGTDIGYSFLAHMVLWLARRWPDRLHIDWPRFEKQEALLERLPLLSLYAETPGLDEEPLSCRQWLARMKGPDETDAAYLAARFQALRVDPWVRETLLDEADVAYRLAAGPDTPSRTRACVPWRGRGVAFQRTPLDRRRPDLARAARRRPRAVRAVTKAEGRALIDLAREAMVTRARDLDIFQHGDPRDVRLVEWPNGLSFAVIGARPERRLLLEAVYGFLTLKNGVPIGYVLNSALFRSAEIAYNVFDTYRGAEAALVYARALATVRHLFHTDTFTIYPYQLGQDNHEALASGAWWFYQKLGFRPREPDAVAVMERELRRMKKNPRHRSTVATLKRLAGHNVYYHLSRPRDDVMGELRLSAVGLKITDSLAERFGADRERGERLCAREAARRFGVSGWARWPAGERLAWRRWAPLLVLLRGVERWGAAARRAAVAVVRAKGGRRESDFALRFDRHGQLRREIRRLATLE